MKKLCALAAVLAVLAAIPVWAGNEGDAAKMQAMKAEFAKCMMCKNFVPVFDELMPVLQTEVVQLDNGMAMVHTVTDPSKVKLLHDADAKMNAAAASCMQLSDADAAKQLCGMCQGMRSLAMSGAQVSHGSTKTGDMIVITAVDPKVKTQVTSFQAQCATMMAGSH